MARSGAGRVPARLDSRTPAVMLFQGSASEGSDPGVIHSVVETAAQGVELAGVAAIVLGALVAAGVFLRHLLSDTSFRDAYHHFRGNLGRAILVGLELLVAADIIVSVTLDMRLERLGALAVVVLIRTFLSFSLEVEIDGHWPWKDSEYRREPRQDKL